MQNNILLHTVAAALYVCAPTPDLDRSGLVDSDDIAIVLASWGLMDDSDLTGDGIIEQADLLTVIVAQGDRWLYVQPHDDFAGAPSLPVPLDEIQWVRENGANVLIGLPGGYTELAAGNVLWWIFELSSHEWEGPVYAGEPFLRAIDALELAEPPTNSEPLWTIHLVRAEDENEDE